MSRHLGALALAARGDLVDLIDEDNAVLFKHLERLGTNIVFIDKFGRLFFRQDLERLADQHFAGLALALSHLTKQAAQLLGHLFHTGRAHHLQGRGRARHIDLDAALGELALAEFFTKALARAALRLARRWRA